MPGFALRRNMVFKWDGGNYRIDRLQPTGDLLLERQADGAMLVVKTEQLLTEYLDGRVSALPVPMTTASAEIPAIYSRPLDALPKKLHQEWVRRSHYVKSLLECHSLVFTTDGMKPLITATAQQIRDTKPPSVTTLYRWYSRYRCHGDWRALIPRTDLRGSRKSTQAAEVFTLLYDATREALEASPQATVSTIFTHLLRKIEVENQLRLPANKIKRPALRTVYRMFARIDVHDHISMRDGEGAANRRLRLNRSGATSDRILERVEVDHTPLDLFLIDDTTCLPLGRPNLTVLVDHYSRMLVGYHVSYESPSTAAVMGALRHAILPKTIAMTALPNLPIVNQWPCYGTPDLLVVDNGLEFHGNSLESVCLDLNIKIQFCPHHQPKYKGVVERYLKTINYYFAHQLPGTSFARMHQRGDYDPTKHAILTFAEFRQIFEKWVLDVYAQQRHRALGVTPYSKWEEGLRQRTPVLPTSICDLQRRIGLTAVRSLRQDGVWLKGIRYSGEELQDLLNAYGEGVRVRVLFDPNDLGAIQVWGPNQETPITVLALDQAYARNLTARQNELIRANLREQGAATENTEALERAKSDIVSMVQQLLASRKQRNRKRAASIRGLNTSKQHPELPMIGADTASGATAKARRPNLTIKEAILTDRYTSFRVKR